MLFDRLIAAGQGSIKLRLHEKFAARREDGVYDPAELRGWFLARLAESAATFDERNGNDFYAAQVAELAELPRYAVECPLHAMKRVGAGK